MGKKSWGAVVQMNCLTHLILLSCYRGIHVLFFLYGENMSPCTGSRVNTSCERIASRAGCQRRPQSRKATRQITVSSVSVCLKQIIEIMSRTRGRVYLTNSVSQPPCHMGLWMTFTDSQWINLRSGNDWATDRQYIINMVNANHVRCCMSSSDSDSDRVSTEAISDRWHGTHPKRKSMRGSDGNHSATCC